MSSYVLQRERIRVLPGLGQKGVPQRMETRVRVGLDLFAQLCNLLFECPRGAVGEVERESASAGPYHETRQLTVALPVSGSGASDSA